MKIWFVIVLLPYDGWGEEDPMIDEDNEQYFGYLILSNCAIRV